MNYLNDKEVDEAARQAMLFYKNDDKEKMFVNGVRWRELRDRCRDKPHVAEVVKCGQVNQFKGYKVIGRTKHDKDELIVGNPGPMSSLEIKLTKESFEHPQEWFDEMFKKNKESTDLKIRNLMTDTKQQLFEINQEAAELGMAGSRKDITDMVSKCDHNGLIGVSCTKCGKWFNFTNE